MLLSYLYTNTIKSKLENDKVISILIIRDHDIALDLGVDDLIKLENMDANDTGNYIWCVPWIVVNISNYTIYSCTVMPCHILICPNTPCHVSYPSKYITYTFNPSFLPQMTWEKRLLPEEYKERLRKCLWLIWSLGSLCCVMSCYHCCYCCVAVMSSHYKLPCYCLKSQPNKNMRLLNICVITVIIVISWLWVYTIRYTKIQYIHPWLLHHIKKSSLDSRW